MIHSERLKRLNRRDPDPDARYVLYWMQQAQRAHFNHALEYAVRRANDLELPVLVGFGLMPEYPEASVRHYRFLLEGLRETEIALAERGIPMVVRVGEPPSVAKALAEKAGLVVCDRGYLRHQRRWRRQLAEAAEVEAVQVEGEVVVPVEAVSDKREYAARTLRPKIARLRADFVSDLSATEARERRRHVGIASEVELTALDALAERLAGEPTVPAVNRFTGGTEQARRRLTDFLRGPFAGYAEGRSEPADYSVSMLSPYLHFGHISPVEVALKVERAKGGSSEDAEAFLEELIVRRELAANYCHFESDYDKYRALPEWARDTLEKHRDDARPKRYTRRQLERAETDDPYWNAAMKEMLHTGYTHNYLRMYWGKKILEWTNTPEYGFRTTLTLNNRYLLDGRDPSSYANVAWCYGLHDRPWGEREVFGTVRSMSASGLERKFDIDRYVDAVDELCSREPGAAR